MLGGLLTLKLAVCVEVKLLIFDYVVAGNISLLSCAQVGFDALGVVAQSSQKLLSRVSQSLLGFHVKLLIIIKFKMAE